MEISSYYCLSQSQKQFSLIMKIVNFLPKCEVYRCIVTYYIEYCELYCEVHKYLIHQITFIKYDAVSMQYNVQREYKQFSVCCLDLVKTYKGN